MQVDQSCIPSPPLTPSSLLRTLARTKDSEADVDVAPAAEAHRAEPHAPNMDVPTWPVGTPQHSRRSSTRSSGGAQDAAAACASWELTDVDFVRSGTRPAPTGGMGPAPTTDGAGPTGAAALSPTRSAVDDAAGGDHSDNRWFDAGWA
jgi:hypothetical protein